MKPVRVGLGRIYAEPGGYRAVIPRPHGRGRARRRFRTIDAAKKWIAANAPAIAIREPLTPAESADYREAVALLPAGASLADAARHYAATIATVAADVTCREAADEFLAAKSAAGRRRDTMRDYACALARLPGKTPLSDLSAKSVIAALDGLNPRRRNNVLAILRTFLRWAVARRYLAADPAASIDKTSLDWTPPKIYTPEQAATIFREAEKRIPALVPVMAMCAFAGLRTSGALRLRPDAIDLSAGVISLSGYADKLRLGYLAPVSTTLRAWLAAHPFTGWDRTANSYAVALDRFLHTLDFPPIRNGLRHSFASYLYAQTQDVHAVAAALGHHGETDTLLRSYRRLASPEDAARYFAIRPAGTKTGQNNAQ